jgi:hypothetical protein
VKYVNTIIPAKIARVIITISKGVTTILYKFI